MLHQLQSILQSHFLFKRPVFLRTPSRRFVSPCYESILFPYSEMNTYQMVMRRQQCVWCWTSRNLKENFNCTYCDKSLSHIRESYTCPVYVIRVAQTPLKFCDGVISFYHTSVKLFVTRWRFCMAFCSQHFICGMCDMFLSHFNSGVVLGTLLLWSAYFCGEHLQLAHILLTLFTIIAGPPPYILWSSQKNCDCIVPTKA